MAYLVKVMTEHQLMAVGGSQESPMSNMAVENLQCTSSWGTICFVVQCSREWSVSPFVPPMILAQSLSYVQALTHEYGTVTPLWGVALEHVHIVAEHQHYKVLESLLIWHHPLLVSEVRILRPVHLVVHRSLVKFFLSAVLGLNYAVKAVTKIKFI